MSKAAIIDATRNLDLKRAKQLLAKKPALATVTDRQGRNLLHIACSIPPKTVKASDAAQVGFAKWLLRKGFEIDEPFGRDKCTPLFEAVARARNPRLVSFLIARGASVAAAPGGALFAASWWGDVKNLKLLLDAGAKIDVVVGVTPFFAAWNWKQFEAAKFLALHGANIDAQDQKGRTALRYGIEKEFDPALLRWLVSHGASADIPANDGVTPRERASRKRDKRFLAALD